MRVALVAAASALLAGLLPAACAPSSPSGRSEPIGLRVDGDPASETFGAVLLGPLRGVEALAPAERTRLEERLAAVSPERAAPLAVWTGTLGAGAATGCVHPEGQPTVLGRLRIAGNHLVFEPRLGFVPGLGYTACADLESLEAFVPPVVELDRTPPVLRLDFTPDGAAAAAAPRVLGVWPAGGTVPENLLRIYLQFSEPMLARDVARRVHVLDADGEVVHEAFVEVPNGLWDARSTRLTLFLHPGRIKRGVGPRQELGPALRAGTTFTLRVDAELTSQRGAALAAPFEQRYRVGAADREAPRPDRWELGEPAGPQAAVSVHFDEPLDRSQLLRFVAVYRESDGTPLLGEAIVSEDGLAWAFTPAAGWRSGRYRVVVRRAIEDLAGNTVDRLFDVETLATATAAPEREVVAPDSGGEIELPFEVR